MSEQEETATEPQDVDTDRVDDGGVTSEGAEDLGDKGKKALDAMKAKWQAERDRRKAAEAKLVTQTQPESEQTDAAKLRDQARAEARAEVLKERAMDKIEAKAAKLFADPEDASALLARRVDEFIDDGTLDVDAIDDALADLLKKKPHLAATAGPRFTGSADGGARKGSGKPQQLTEQDLKRMTPDQIVAAQDKGQLDELLGVS